MTLDRPEAAKAPRSENEAATKTEAQAKNLIESVLPANLINEARTDSTASNQCVRSTLEIRTDERLAKSFTEKTDVVYGADRSSGAIEKVAARITISEEQPGLPQVTIVFSKDNGKVYESVKNSAGSPDLYAMVPGNMGPPSLRKVDFNSQEYNNVIAKQNIIGFDTLPECAAKNK